ncbi:hypothetical protein [Paenibacillus xylanilyticus]|uniref:hypothetical protein n=1 Tax=Paenibacillus xylanilyticus TaxID=248903 RepID=UPI00129DF6C3|nr:hypothetical protein [Paenibacillus xylanilyticus]
MPAMPLRQTVIVSPFLSYDPDYNEPSYGDDYALKCRFSEEVKLVRNQRGEEVASVGAFFFDRLPSLNISDRLTYTDENMRTTSYTPIAISVKRALNGKPILTEVHV